MRLKMRERFVVRNRLFVKALMSLISLASFFLIVGVVRGNVAEEATSPLGKQITEFKAVDWQGREHQLSEYTSKKILVIAFLGTECPLAKQYAGRLKEIREGYAKDGVEVIAVDSNVQDSLEDLAAFARRQSIDFPILKDAGGEIAAMLGATRTPEVFVLDAQRKVQYYGRIDDRFGIGYVKKKADQEDLTLALNELVSGSKVTHPHQAAVGCRIGKSRSAKEVTGASEVTFSKQIVRLLQDHCVECHRSGEIGPMELTQYSEVVGWADMIQEVIHQGRMPPWHASPAHGAFANDRSLSDEEIGLIDRWVAAGAPEGDRKDLPEQRIFTDGWMLPKQPDLVVAMADKPFQVPARGDVRYQYFRVDPGFKEDKWLSSAEIQPSNRAVVHHVLVFVREKGSLRGLEGERGFLVGYVPGTRVKPYPEGMAKRIPAGSELVFQVHYTPIGTEQEDLTRLGLVFADPKSVTREVKTTSVVQVRLNIPPRDGSYEVSAMLREELPESDLLLMSPHMHLRGKSFRYTLVKPDGSREILLDVPRYDFNWQTAYWLKEPLKLTAGSKIFCEAVFDNSEDNLNNPDPSKWVRWGDQTYEEMMIGYFDIAVDRTKVAAAPADTPAFPLETLRGAFKRWDKNQDQSLDKSEVPERWHVIFERIDKDRNEEISQKEMESLGRTP